MQNVERKKEKKKRARFLKRHEEEKQKQIQFGYTLVPLLLLWRFNIPPNRTKTHFKCKRVKKSQKF